MSDNNNNDSNKWTSNLVTRADRSLMGRRNVSEATGTPESIWGKIDPRDMGSRVTFSKPEEESGEKKLNNELTEKKKQKNTDNVKSVIEDFFGLKYRPRTTETREVYQMILYIVSSAAGDVSSEVLRQMTDEVIRVVKEMEKDYDCKRKIEEIVDVISGDTYEKLKNLINKLSDYTVNNKDLSESKSSEEEIAVVFKDDEDEEGELQLVASDQSESEEEEEESEKDKGEEEEEEDEEVKDEIFTEKKEDINISEIDKFWLQRRLSKYYLDAESAQEMAEKVLQVLKVAETIRECENKLVEILDYDKFELVSMLTRNQELIYWKCVLESSDNKDEIKGEMLKRGLGELLIRINKKDSDAGVDAMEITRENDSDRVEHVMKEVKYLNLEELKFTDGSHLMTNKQCKLPEGSYKTVHEGYEEIVIPAPVSTEGDVDRLIDVQEMPEFIRKAFKGARKLNRIQSKVYPCAMESQENMLVCAPTGAGKTNVAMLCIMQTLMQYTLDELKIVYIAPMKALVQEMVGNFSSRLSAEYGVKVEELTGDRQLTGKELAEANIIVTTPEKWDVVTRKQVKDGYTSKVRLVIIDEVHLLHDLRGPRLESLIARYIRHQPETRLVALSATLPNFTDVAYFMRVNQQTGLFYFDQTYRPCPLEQRYLGVDHPKRMNDLALIKVRESCLKEQNQVIIFTHSRKDTFKTAKFIQQKLLDSGEFLLANGDSKQILERESQNVTNAELQQIMPQGLGIHHAGMQKHERQLVEDLFADGHLRVLVSTATLAWGVNLPAHTVIIKGTKVYSAEEGKWTELSPQDVLQMLGRAGRPQYDTTGQGIIITGKQELQFYLSLLNQQLPIESQLISMLPEALNAENLQSVEDGCDWLAYTFLYVRMLRQPNLYGISHEEFMQDQKLLERRRQLIHSACIQLERSGLLKYDRRTGKIQSTELGRIASDYDLKQKSAQLFNKQLQPYMDWSDILRLLASADEFQQLQQVRDEELVEVQQLLQRVPIPIVDSAAEPLAKIQCLLQAYISQLQLEGFALRADMIFIHQNSQRLSRAMFAISLLKRNQMNLSNRLLLLSLMLKHCQWTSMSPLRQLITNKSSQNVLIKKLEKKSITIEQLRELKDGEIVQMLQLNQTQLTELKQLLSGFPQLQVEAELQPITRSLLQINLIITSTVNGKYHLFVGDVDGQQLLYSNCISISSSNKKMMSICVLLSEPVQPNYFLWLQSDELLHACIKLPLSFNKLTLPRKFQQWTDLLDTSISVGEEFNIHQHNVLQQAQNESFIFSGPPACGKTFLGVWEMLKAEGKCLYLCPNAQTLDMVYSQLAVKAKSRNILLLTGNATLDRMQASNNSNDDHLIILSKPEYYKNYNFNIKLVVADDLHDLSWRYEVIMTSFVIDQIKIIGLSTSTANAKDLQQWLQCKHLFNYSPMTRQLPVEFHFNNCTNLSFKLNEIVQNNPNTIIDGSSNSNSSKSSNSVVAIVSENQPFIHELKRLFETSSKLEGKDCKMYIFTRQLQQRQLFKRFLLTEGLVIESELFKQLPNALLDQINQGVIKSTQDAIDWLSWTLYYRRLFNNPNYYHLILDKNESINDLINEHLSQLIEESIQDLRQSQCISPDDDNDLELLNLGLIANYYHVDYLTMEIYQLSLQPSTKLRGLLELLSSSLEFQSFSVSDDDQEFLSLVSLPFQTESLVFQLLQSHFSRIHIPKSLHFLQQEILGNTFKLINAMIDVCSSNGFLSPALSLMELSQMLTQGMWGDRESPLKQLPYFNSDRLRVCKDLNLQTMFDFLEAVDSDDLQAKLFQGLSPVQISEIASVANAFPASIQLKYSLHKEEGFLEISLSKDEETLPFHFPHLNQRRLEGWWLVIGDFKQRQLLAIKRFTFTLEQFSCRLQIPQLESTSNQLKLLLMSDSWIGCDQEFDFFLE